jgi:HlyD family secretion protein
MVAVHEREKKSDGNINLPERPIPHKPRRSWTPWIVAFCLLIVASGLSSYFMRPMSVSVAPPSEMVLAETITSSGVVQGHTDAIVGPQVPGIVSEVLVEEGAHVRAGQLLARVQDNVARQQVGQAAAAVASSRAALAQATAGPLQSEIGSGAARASQAQIGVRQALSAVARAKIGIKIAESGVLQAKTQQARAQAQLAQAESRLGLSEKTRDRKRVLYEEGAIPGASFDEAQSAYEVAKADEAAAAQALQSSFIAISTAEDSLASAREELKTAEAQVAAAQAAAAAAASDLSTLRSQPREQAVSVAAKRLTEAEAAYQTARTQASNSEVRAPFDGTVTEILAHAGASAVAGIVRLVGTRKLEVRVDLDENDLAKLKMGQRAILAAADEEIEGRVVRLGSEIDSLRGTLPVFVAPNTVPIWLTPGQTLNVNLVVNEKVRRLLVPSTAVQREGDQTIVYVVRNGRAKSVPVRLGAVSGDKVPVLEGLSAGDSVIQNAIGLSPETRVVSKGR